MNVHIVSKRPPGKNRQRFVVCQIEMKRSDGDVPPVDGVKVGAGLVVQMRLFTADPEIFPSAGICFADYFSDEGALSLTSYQGRLHFISGTVRDVDV